MKLEKEDLIQKENFERDFFTHFIILLRRAERITGKKKSEVSNFTAASLLGILY